MHQGNVELHGYLITSTYLRPFDRQYLPDIFRRRTGYIEFPKVIMSETFFFYCRPSNRTNILWNRTW